MSRSRRRISRALLGLLACTIALGLVFWLHNLNKTRAQDATAAEAAAAAAVAPAPENDPVAKAAVETPAPRKTVALVTQTPTAAPALPPPGSITITPTNAAAPRVQVLATPAVNSSTPGDIRPTAPAAIHSAAPLADARAKQEAGDLLAARAILNTALLGGNLSPADTAAAKKMLGELNAVIVLSPRKFADDDFASAHTVRAGEYLQKIASNYEVTSEFIARLNGISDPRLLQAGRTLKIVRGPFHAVVDKSDYTMDIYIGAPGETGSLYVTTFPVGLGADDSTPTGTWSVEPQKKIKNPTYFSPRGEGIIEADDPANPLGEFWIGLTGIDGHAVGKQSYGIHGTIEPDSIGKQASMGCIRMGKDEIAMVFELLVEGKSTVIVRE